LYFKKWESGGGLNVTLKSHNIVKRTVEKSHPENRSILKNSSHTEKFFILEKLKETSDCTKAESLHTKTTFKGEGFIQEKKGEIYCRYPKLKPLLHLITNQNILKPLPLHLITNQNILPVYQRTSTQRPISLQSTTFKTCLQNTTAPNERPITTTQIK